MWRLHCLKINVYTADGILANHRYFGETQIARDGNAQSFLLRQRSGPTHDHLISDAYLSISGRTVSRCAAGSISTARSTPAFANSSIVAG